MRLIPRAVGLLALALAAVTCTDAPTAPRGSRSARVGLSPSFSAGAARAYRALGQLGFEIVSARVRLVADDGRVAADTVVAFPTTQDTLTLDLSVDVEGGEQTFTAIIELRDASGLALFSGRHLVTARARALPGAAPAPFVLDYAGPGRDARAITLTPSRGAMSAGGTVSLTAAGVDSAGRAVPDLLVRWTTSDTTLARVEPTASAAASLRGAGRRGVVTVDAVTPTGLTASATLSLVPPASRLIVIGGHGQSGIGGRTLAEPFVVELQAADGGPVPGATIRFRAATAGGAVSSATAVTDSLGRAGSALRLGRRPGTYAFEASAEGLSPVAIDATAIPAPPSGISVASGDAQRAAAGAPLEHSLEVLVVDEDGEPAAGATVEWSVVEGAGALASSATTTGSDGRAAVGYALGPQAGRERVRAALAGNGASVEFRLEAEAGSARGFRLLQSLPSSLAVGVPSAITLRVQLVDALGNPVAEQGTVATATGVVTPGNPPPFVVSASSDAVGIVTFPLPAYAGALGTASITVTAPGLIALALPPITFVTGPLAALRIDTQPAGTGWSGVRLAVQPVLQLSDAGRNSVKSAGVPVTAYVASGGGTLAGTTTVLTDALGAATFTDLAIAGSTGAHTLGFSSPSLRDAISGTIDVAAAATALGPVSGALAPSAASNSVVMPAFGVRLVDASGLPVARAGVPITLAATAVGGVTPAAPLVGTTTRLTDASGVATFDDVGFAAPAGDYTLTATADPATIVLPVLTLVAALTVN